MVRPTSLVIIQPHIPRYVVPLFDQLHAALLEHNIELTVVHGQPLGMHSHRADTASPRPWTLEVHSTRIALPAGRAVLVKRVQHAIKTINPDLVIVEQAIKNMEAYPLLIRQSIGGPSIAMWGHGRSYSTSQGAAAAAFKQWLTRRSQWFFAYTQSGANYVVGHGFPRTRTTVLNNTIDTESLRRDLEAVSDVELAEFRARYGLIDGRAALFLGGVDKDKGIDFLFAAAAEAARIMPGFVLLIGGDGAMRPQCEAAQAAGAPIRVLGRLDGHPKALALQATDVLAVPDSIGLVAIDSLVASRPIVGTIHALHGPERDYLETDRTAVFADHNPTDYAAALIGLLSDPERLRVMQAASLSASEAYSLGHTVRAFVDGVLAWDEIRRFNL